MGSFVTANTISMVLVLVLVSAVLSPGSSCVINCINKRSDDLPPLQAVVEQISQQLVQLTAQVEANKNRIDDTQRAVGFTARKKLADVRGLRLYETIVFDDVVYNAGDGYDPQTGFFTAPVSGSYVFFLQTMLNNHDEERLFLDITKNGSTLARAHAGYSNFENGSTMVTTHLVLGERVMVRITQGSQFWGEFYTTFAGFRISST